MCSSQLLHLLEWTISSADIIGTLKVLMIISVIQGMYIQTHCNPHTHAFHAILQLLLIYQLKFKGGEFIKGVSAPNISMNATVCVYVRTIQLDHYCLTNGVTHLKCLAATTNVALLPSIATVRHP